MYRRKRCLRYGNLFFPTSGNQDYCTARCRKLDRPMRRVPRCSKCSARTNGLCEAEKGYVGKFSPRNCPDRI